jgi:hypothetical protein
MTSWVLVDGLSRLLLAVAAFIAVDLLLDWAFHMDRAQRAVMLGLAAALIAMISYRRLWRPLSATPTDDALVLEVEQQHPQLRESLISAVQFARSRSVPDTPSVRDTDAGVSPAMVQATVDLGVRAAQEIEFASVLHKKRFLSNAVLLALALLLLGGTAVAGFASDAVAIWFNRNVLLGNREWPQDVHFQIAGAVEGVLTVPRGDDWPLEVLVTEDSRRLPDELWLELQGTRRRQRMETLDGGRRFHTTLGNVSEPLAFRVVERRAASPWIAVELVDRPAVESLELTVTPPAYTGGAAEPLPPGGGPYTLLKGSTLAIRGQATRPLSAATLRLGETLYPLTITDAGTGRARLLPSRQAAEGASSAARQEPRPPGPQDSVAGSLFALDLLPDQLRDGDYAIDLQSAQRLWLPGHDQPQPLASREPATFRLRLGPDRQPQVQARLTGISNLVTPRAFIPIETRITDDFGVADVRLQHRHRGERDEADTTGTQPLRSLAKLPDRDVRFDHIFDLEPFALPTGVSLSFFIEAEDNNSVSGPGVGRSTVFLVRVVTEEELRAALLAREREQRVEFEKRIKVQDELLTDSRALLAGVRGRPDLDDDQRDQLTKAGKRQKTVGDDLSRIARRFEDVVVEVRQNRIEAEDGPLQTRLTGQIITPLWTIANESVASVTQLLERSRLKAASPEDRDALLAQAASAQERVLEQMREVLSHMEQAEGFQEAVNALIEVQKAQQDVLQRTDKEKEEAIRRLLDGEGKR